MAWPRDRIRSATEGRPMSGEVQRVAVLGAGAAGLSAAQHLLAHDHDVTVFEKGSKVGGLWVYDNDNGLSAAYSSLHINSEPRVTHYRGHPFREGTSLFPSHGDVARYLEDFSYETGVSKHIRFNAHVTAVDPVAQSPGLGFRLRLDNGEEQQFDSVIVATGHQGVPRHPPFAHKFEGEYLHSNSYRKPDNYAGKRVLVVGVGNSGLDIAADICTRAERTTVAARSPVLIMPRMLFGVPSARVIGALNRPFLPWPVQRAVMRAISRAVHGPMEQWGFRTPKTRTHPASNATFMSHVAYRKIDVRPGVTGVAGKEVQFSDGTVETVDTIIAATGYLIHLPFLTRDVSPVSGDRVDLYRRVVHPDWPGLYFIGFFNVSGGANISMMDVQADWMAALVSGEATLPDAGTMRRRIREDHAYVARRYPGTPRYGLELEPRRYRRQIEEEMKRGIVERKPSRIRVGEGAGRL